ncbi:major facilitator superfamily transporter [Nitratireductor indicus C115]|uniref:Major facilitator superfamily transporter n=1 Tax=Nitratireductor indicus C115 TaxID=1231190 RepID=K2N5T9_9HYPH|nr:MFS transporter [Nitratireductor indicus]EKF42823.1 major facilitator superfamily transporter [Nitratireductor indicus C115]SFQ40802.1 Predicted arabinose efflux permease, MFS family [Nitratireductor indicus]
MLAERGDLYREAKRTALILAVSQAVVGSAAPIAISMGGLAGFYLLGSDKSLATAPVTGFNIGVAVGALPAAALTRAIGRRNSLMSGGLVTACGGFVAALALFQANFWLFALGLLLVGMGNAFLQQYRFAAADNAPSDFKARAISWVLGGGVFAAIIGPQIVIHTRDLFAPIMFAGAFASLIVIGLLGAAVLSLLRASKDAPSAKLDDHQPARPLLAIMTQPRFLVALLCGVAAYALMSFVMTGAPLAMVGCGFTPDEATLGISWHVMAMFAPSFVTGRLIARFGKETIVATGLLLLIGCAVVALSGIALWQFWTALILLGVGWNFGFIGATAMVADCYHASEKSAVQGVHDFILFSTTAVASLMSGQIYNAYGWDMLAIIVLPVSIFCLAALGVQALRRRSRAVA